jgi:hypothetical protein
MDWPRIRRIGVESTKVALASGIGLAGPEGAADYFASRGVHILSHGPVIQHLTRVLEGAVAHSGFVDASQACAIGDFGSLVGLTALGGAAFGALIARYATRHGPPYETIAKWPWQRSSVPAKR